MAAGGETGGQNNHRLLTFWPVTSSGLSWVPDKLYQRDIALLFDRRREAAGLGLPSIDLDPVLDFFLRSYNLGRVGVRLFGFDISE